MKQCLTLAIAALCSVFALAHDITLTWSPSPDMSNVTGYKIYYGQVGQPLTNVWLVGNTNLTTISNLVSSTNVLYRFTCAATNSAGESPSTMELVTLIPPHAVKHPRFVSVSSHEVKVAWEAPDEADIRFYRVNYGTLNPATTNVLQVAAPSTSATISSNVVANAEHYFNFTAVNSAGVESWPKYQLREKLLPAGPSQLKVTVLVE